MLIYDVKDVTLRRHERFTLDIESFTLAAGEKVAVVGPNGSGKTTLLRVLGLLEGADRCARFLYRGREVQVGRDRESVPRGRLGFLKQQPYLFRGSVGQNLAFALRLRGYRGPEVRPRVDAMLELIDLAAHADTSVHRLSGGEQKRLALGRVLIGEPDVLLLDEPSAHLDHGSTRVIEQALAASQAALVLATHDLRLAHRIAPRVLNLKAGCLAPGLPENILAGRRTGDDLQTSGGLRIHLPRAEAPGPADGDAVVIMLDPRNLVLSLEPLASSMRNQFRGRVCAVHGQGDDVWVEVDCGERLTAIITRESYEALGLNLDREVVVSFKTHAVEVL